VELASLAKKDAQVRKSVDNVRIVDTIGWTSTPTEEKKTWASKFHFKVF